MTINLLLMPKSKIFQLALIKKKIPVRKKMNFFHPIAIPQRNLAQAAKPFYIFGQIFGLFAIGNGTSIAWLKTFFKVAVPEKIF